MTTYRLTYDVFEPDTLMGTWEETFTPELAGFWKQMFAVAEGEQAAMQGGLIVACMMRAYLNVLAGRPPGNIHGRQTLHIDSLPQPGEVIRTDVWCRHKEIRRNRRYIVLELVGSGPAQQPLFRGNMDIIWAA